MSRMSLPAVRHPDDRPIATLRALVAYAREHERWPDAYELARFRPRRTRLGSRATVQRELAALRDRGLAELRGLRTATRWLPTFAGFDVLGIAPYQPKGERGPAMADVAAILATTMHASHNQRPAPVIVRHGVFALPSNLEIAD
jgi:hypothetical protein